MSHERINGRNISRQWLNKHPDYRAEQEQIAAVKKAAWESDQLRLTDKQAADILKQKP